MRFFHILLKSDKKKVVHALYNIIKNIPEIEITPAIDASTNELEFSLEDRIISSEYLKYCTRTELANILSHIRVWKKIVNEDISEAVILKENAIIFPDFLEQFDILYNVLPKDYPRDSHFLYLQKHTEKLKLSLQSTNNTIGYLITKEIALELIEIFDTSIDLPLDETISFYLNKFGPITNLIEIDSDFLYNENKDNENNILQIKNKEQIENNDLYDDPETKVNTTFYFDQGEYLSFPCCDVLGNYDYDENHTLMNSKIKYLFDDNVLAFNSEGVLKNNLDNWVIAPTVSLYVKTNRKCRIGDTLQKHIRKAILLTGGCGYIASHCLLELLLSSTEDIVIIDNLSNSSNNNVNKIKDLGNVYIYNEDITNKEKCKEIFSNHNITTVIHFAAYKAVKESIDDPLKYYSNNINGLLVLLKCMKIYNVSKIIFSSSATVYGMPKDGELPINESVKINTLNPYGRTKYFSEEILRDVSFAHNIKVICLRYFNPVGCYYLIPENSNTITNLFPMIVSVIKGEKDYLSIYGNDYNTSRSEVSINSQSECNHNTSRTDCNHNTSRTECNHNTHDGTAIRDYIHVMDLAKGHLAALNYLDNMEQNFDVFNLGTGIGYSILEVLNCFLKYKNVEYKFEDRRPGDAPEVYADASKALKILNWKATLTLKDMVLDSLQ
jgi:UDP-glucose 4-epimerase